MKLNFFFPIQLFLIFKNLFNIVFFFKNSLQNIFYYFLNSNNFFLYNRFLKNECFLGLSYLVDSSNYELKKRDILYFNYYFYFFNIKIIFLLYYKNFFKSISLIYLNANWIERETSEMYGIFFYFKKDTRKLLLNYSFINFPLKKNFFFLNKFDIFYNFYLNNISYYSNNSIEL